MRTETGATRGPDKTPRWRKSRRSNPSGNCVEVAALARDRIGVRNSRHPDGAVLVFPHAPFRELLVAVADGALDINSPIGDII